MSKRKYRNKKLSKLGVKLGYVHALKALKRIANDYDFEKDTNKLMGNIINDFEYCVDKTERFNKLEEARYLSQEAFAEEVVEGACPFCNSLKVKQYDDEVGDAGILLMNKCKECKKEWQ